MGKITIMPYTNKYPMSLMGIGIYSPGLDEKGNSIAGIKLLEKLSKTLYLSIF